MRLITIVQWNPDASPIRSLRRIEDKEGGMFQNTAPQEFTE